MTDYNRDLRFDKRLLRRRGWVEPETLEAELAALPDVSDKATTAEAEPAPEGGSDGDTPPGA